MGQQQSFSGAAVKTAATAAIGSGDTTISVTALQGTWPNTAFGPFAITINRNEADEERVLIASYSSTLLTCAGSGRGYDGTTAASHSNGATIEHTLDGAWHQDISAKVYSAAKGALWYWSAANTPGQLAIGSTGNFLRVSAGVPAWSSIVAADIEGLFTAAGQLFVGTGSGTGELLAAGSNGQFLELVSGLPAWSALLKPTAQSANYNANPGDLVLMSGGHIVTLPTSPFTGAQVAVVNADGNIASGLTSGTGAKIYGLGLGSGVAAGTTVPLGIQSSFMVVEYDGTNWQTVAGQQDSGWLGVSALGFSNSWGAGGDAPQYRISGNVVRLRGSLTAGTANTTAFTLPAGYRPTALTTFMASSSSNSSWATVLVNTNGTVQPITSLGLNIDASFAID